MDQYFTWTLCHENSFHVVVIWIVAADAHFCLVQQPSSFVAENADA